MSPIRARFVDIGELVRVSVLRVRVAPLSPVRARVEVGRAGESRLSGESLLAAREVLLSSFVLPRASPPRYFPTTFSQSWPSTVRPPSLPLNEPVTITGTFSPIR